ncbi:MAG: enolase C-terminal domain-like protein, partial [Verrucomicrobiota bacterium]
VGATCVPHLSGTGLGLLYNLLFVATLPNAGPYHEFKDFDQSIPLECPTSSLRSEDGVIKVPTEPGSGVDLDPDFLAKHRLVEE